jgi:hypothetical protein
MPTKRKQPATPTGRTERKNHAPAPQRFTSAERLAELLAHAERRGIKPISDPDTMMADFWPPEESIDEFIAAVRALRRQGR